MLVLFSVPTVMYGMAELLPDVVEAVASWPFLYDSARPRLTSLPLAVAPGARRWRPAWPGGARARASARRSRSRRSRPHGGGPRRPAPRSRRGHAARSRPGRRVAGVQGRGHAPQTWVLPSWAVR